MQLISLFLKQQRHKRKKCVIKWYNSIHIFNTLLYRYETFAVILTLFLPWNSISETIPAFSTQIEIFFLYFETVMTTNYLAKQV